MGGVHVARACPQLMACQSQCGSFKFVNPCSCSPTSGRAVQVAGWGRTLANVPAGADVLQEVAVTIVGPVACNASYNGTLAGSMLCAGTQRHVATDWAAVARLLLMCTHRCRPQGGPLEVETRARGTLVGRCTLQLQAPLSRLVHSRPYSLS
jgi:hypothetical protein